MFKLVVLTRMGKGRPDPGDPVRGGHGQPQGGGRPDAEEGHAHQQPTLLRRKKIKGAELVKIGIETCLERNTLFVYFHIKYI